MLKERKATAAKKAVKVKSRTSRLGSIKSSSKTVSHPMSMLQKELQLLKAALQSAKKKARTAKKEATQFGTKTAHKIAVAAANEKVKLESKAAELNQKVKAMHIGDRIHALYEQVKKAEADVEAKVKQFQEQLTHKTMDDFEKAIDGFKKKWHKRKVQANAKIAQAKRRQLAAKAKATAQKVSKRIKHLEKKAASHLAIKKTASVRKPRAEKTAAVPVAKKPVGRRGRPAKA